METRATKQQLDQLLFAAESLYNKAKQTGASKSVMEALYKVCDELELDLRELVMSTESELESEEYDQ